MKIKDPKNIINTRYGEGSLHQQNRIKQTILKALGNHSRISLIRLDLHFPDDDIHFLMDYEVISRFFKDVKEQIPAYLRKKLKQMELNKPDKAVRVHDTKVSYFWVREYGKETYYIGQKVHYHIVLLLNYSAFNSIKFTKGEVDSLYTVISDCWLKATEVFNEKYRKLVHVPENPVYSFTRKDLEEKGIDGIYDPLKDRLDYFIKFKSKDFHNNRRSFGCSQG
ncbi:inovirus Gp2 family protein [Scandinavium sp. M-37]|uniref:inovirus Gp2 family protein n=1 Tax=Scandinavium sp. M-37 TaxID=3373077 RepID=UPI00374619C4